MSSWDFSAREAESDGEKIAAMAVSTPTEGNDFVFIAASLAPEVHAGSRRTSG